MVTGVRSVRWGLNPRLGLKKNSHITKLEGALLAAVVAACIFLAGCGSGGGNSGGQRLSATVAATQHPLVANFLVGSECTGQAMAEFGPDTSYGRSTSWYPVTANKPLTIPVAGMRASTMYHMRVDRQCGSNTISSPDTTFTTGALPSMPFPAVQVSRPAPSPSSPENTGIELVDILAPTANQMQAFFTDRDGYPIWYYNVDAGYVPNTFKLLPNGHFLVSIANTAGDSLIREVDLAGNKIRELEIVGLQQKMQAAGFNFVPTEYHHDFLPLDNGHIIVLTNVDQDFTDLPGYPGTTTVVGDALIDLDPDWNPVWAWNGFDHLDVNRHLNGLPDWTHSNAITYLPSDGNLLLSMRHQSWVLKIDYNNGAGTGNLLWRLGYQGDFTLAQGDDPSLWFSFQHYPSLIDQSGSQSTLAIWDNGDSRPLDTSGTICLFPGPPTCYSRATIFQIDESSMVANLNWEYLPGGYGVWGGSISQLANGNVEFDLNSPLDPAFSTIASEVQEVTQTATPQVVWKMDVPLPTNAYRAYRVPSLYPGVSWDY